MKKKSFLFILTAGLIWSFSAQIASASPWARSYNAAKKTRFIPVELWTGGQWSVKRSIAFKRANLSFGRGKRITGPKRWRNPHNGVTYSVYQRTNREKVQLFARRGGSGLGRVYDSRRPRYCTPGFKFPLGAWRQGQTRTVRQTCWNGNDQSSRFTRRLTIKIEKIDFVYNGVPHSLRFRWIADNGGRGKDNSYIYSPGRGQVAFVRH